MIPSKGNWRSVPLKANYVPLFLSLRNSLPKRHVRVLWNTFFVLVPLRSSLLCLDPWMFQVTNVSLVDFPTDPKVHHHPPWALGTHSTRSCGKEVIGTCSNPTWGFVTTNARWGKRIMQVQGRLKIVELCAHYLLKRERRPNFLVMSWFKQGIFV